MHFFTNLKETVEKAEQIVSIGGLYTHYRNADHQYKVLAIAINEKTEEPCVVYQALYGEKLIWIRSLSVWCDSIEYEGKNVLRFIKITSQVIVD